MILEGMIPETNPPARYTFSTGGNAPIAGFGVACRPLALAVFLSTALFGRFSLAYVHITLGGFTARGALAAPVAWALGPGPSFMTPTGLESPQDIPVRQVATKAIQGAEIGNY